MKILIIASKTGSVPYVPELIHHLQQKGDKVDMLNTNDWRFISESWFRSKLMRRILIIYCNGNGNILFNFFVKKFIKYDAVNLHYATPNICFNFIDKIKCNTVITIWGSDFLRIDALVRLENKSLYNKASFISFNNPQIQQKFVSYYEMYDKKCRIVRWGIDNFDRLRVISIIQPALAKKKLGVNSEKLAVCIGYNAGKAQQHKEILDVLAKLDSNLKHKIQLILPLTYGEDYVGYIGEIKLILNSMDIEYHVFDSYMSTENVVLLRYASDIVLNFQITDSFSASIQEHLLYGCNLFVGKWLPYEALEKVTDKIHFFDSVEEILPELKKVIHLGQVERSFNKKIYDLGAWEKNIEDWRSMYSECSFSNKT